MGFHAYIMKLSLGIRHVFTSVCVVAAWYSFYKQTFLIRLSFPHLSTSLFRLLLVLTESHGKYSERIRSEVLYVSAIGAILDSFGKFQDLLLYNILGSTYSSGCRSKNITYTASEPWCALYLMWLETLSRDPWTGSERRKCEIVSVIWPGLVLEQRRPKQTVAGGLVRFCFQCETEMHCSYHHYILTLNLAEKRLSLICGASTFSPGRCLV